jgi:4-amino-4-deoxy-L-arabinose transferase-like glycosyltransferase
VLLSLVWFAGVVLLFSLPAAKLPHYLLPSHPAAALLTALFIERASRFEAPRWLWWTGTTLVTSMLLAASVLVWALLRRTSTAGLLPPLVLPAILVGGAVAILVYGWRRGPFQASAALAATAACAAGYAALVVVPGLEGLQSVPQLGARIAASGQSGARVGQYGSVVSAGLVYYARHTVVLVTGIDDAVAFLRGPGQAFLVIPAADAKAITALAPETVHEVASSPRLVVRFDRLFGDRSPYEDGLVVLANRAEPSPP